MAKKISRRNALLGASGAILSGTALSAVPKLLGDSSDSLGSIGSNESNSSKGYFGDSSGSFRSSFGSSSVDPTYPFRVNYGNKKDQFGNLYLPVGIGRVPLVVMLHGGGWEAGSTVLYTESLALDLVSKGVAVWNVEYSRVGGGGGWPQTFNDMDMMVNAIPTFLQGVARGRLDLNNAHIIGHSAGGHLAAWVINRRNIKSQLLGPAPKFKFKSAVLMAAVLDTVYAVNYGNDQFVPTFLGGYPDQMPTIYNRTSPIQYLPSRVATVCIHGTADTLVSYKQSVRYVKRAIANKDRSQLVLMPGVGHGAFGNLFDPAWWRARDLLFDNIKRPVI